MAACLLPHREGFESRGRWYLSKSLGFLNVRSTMGVIYFLSFGRPRLSMLSDFLFCVIRCSATELLMASEVSSVTGVISVWAERECPTWTRTPNLAWEEAQLVSTPTKARCRAGAARSWGRKREA